VVGNDPIAGRSADGSRGAPPPAGRRTLAPNEPRCTGMCGAWPPARRPGQRTAQEKFETLAEVSPSGRSAAQPYAHLLGTALKRWLNSSRADRIDASEPRWACGHARPLRCMGQQAGSRRLAVPPSSQGRAPGCRLASTTSAGPLSRAAGADPRAVQGNVVATRLPVEAGWVGPWPPCGEAVMEVGRQLPVRGPGPPAPPAAKLPTTRSGPSGPFALGASRKRCDGPARNASRRAGAAARGNGRVSSLPASRTPNTELGPGGGIRFTSAGARCRSRATRRRIEGVHAPPLASSRWSASRMP